MAISLSPGVSFTEVDLTTIVPSVPSSIGAFAGNFSWGPLEQIVDISDEIQLVSVFGKPDSNTFIDFFTCANFLAYANTLKVVRAANNSAHLNASNGTGVLIKNDIDYLINWANGTTSTATQTSAANTNGPFVARFPGSLGNSLLYSICDASNTVFQNWKWKSYFQSAPNTSSYIQRLNASLGPNALPANDEVHIIVVDADGAITGTPNTVLERYEYLSRARGALSDDGSSIHYGTAINNRSKWLRWISQPRATQLSGSNISPIAGGSNVYDIITYSNIAIPVSTSTLEVRLANGSSSLSNTSANVANAYSYFSNADEVDISLLMTGEPGSRDKLVTAINIAEARKDCLVFISPRQVDVVNNFGNETNSINSFRANFGTSGATTTSSSYAVMDSGWKYQYDKYNDTYRWIPLNGDIAGLCARTDREKDPWYSPGGLNRGFIKNIVRLAFNPTKTQRDLLYLNQVNPVVTFSGQGTVLFGDKTLLNRPSAFDRINVRRLFIVLEQAISKAAKYSLFEFNDTFTRAQFVNLVEPYLRDVQGRRGITDFRVVCDDTNNTGEVIDRNEFVGDIYIKPARSINFIQLNFVATRSGIDFQEIVGRF
jgi:phage tail sheath protein FI